MENLIEEFVNVDVLDDADLIKYNPTALFDDIGTQGDGSGKTDIGRSLRYGLGRGYFDSSHEGSSFGTGGDREDKPDGFCISRGIEITKFNGKKVYNIDSTPTIITKVRGNIAKGFIVQMDLRLQPCYIAKSGKYFSHGSDVRDAVENLEHKLIRHMSKEELVDLFLQNFELSKKYPAKDFYEWHFKLTGSCRIGRDKFVESHSIDLKNDTFTVQEFVDLTKEQYGRAVIRHLEERIKSTSICNVDV